MFSSTEYLQSPRKDVNFREYKPYARGNAARITDDQWEPYFLLIRQLHNARRTRAQIIDVLREHGMEPSVAQLYAKMSKWGLKGYGPGTTSDQDNYAVSLLTANTIDASDITTTTIGGASLPWQPPNDNVDYSSDESKSSQESASCFSSDEPDTSDTMYETEDLPMMDNCAKEHPSQGGPEISTGSLQAQPSTLTELIEADATSDTVDGSDTSSTQSEVIQGLPTDLMAFVSSTGDMSDFDKHDILNEVATFLCATSSFSDAFVLFHAAYGFLRESQGPPMALVFATINCLRSATFKEQCQYAGSLMGEALGSFRLLSYSNPYAVTAFSALEEIGRELCVKSELEHLNILYTQMQFTETTCSMDGPSRRHINELLLHCSDPFLLSKVNDRPELLTQSMEVSGIALDRMIGKLSRWCSTEIKDFNPVSMLPSAGFNPSDTVSVARFATALSCHFIRKWSFLSLAEVLANCNELLPPNRKDAAARLCKLAVRILSTLAVYTIYQATGTTLRSVSGDECAIPLSEAQYLSPLATHLDALSRMRHNQRVLVFAEMHKTLYNRTLVYRQQMDEHCLTAHVRETGFLLAASLIRLKRELDCEVPKPAPTPPNADDRRMPTPSQLSTTSSAQIASSISRSGSSHSPSRKSSDSSSSMRRLARRNLLVPGIMSANGSQLRSSWLTRRLSTESNESWNFSKVTGLPDAPTPPPESVRTSMEMQRGFAGGHSDTVIANTNNTANNSNEINLNDTITYEPYQRYHNTINNEDYEMTGMNMF